MRAATNGSSARYVRPRRGRRGALAISAVLVLVSACNDNGGSGQTAPATADDDSTVDDAPAAETPVADDDPPAAAAAPPGVVVDVISEGTPIDPRILGTNVPAWLGPETFAAPWFVDAIGDAGIASIRMPGGSWSNSYDWAGCENADPDLCYWTWASRPSDFIELLATTGVVGIWTLSINATAQSAAAAVAFFNGDVADSRVIGVDRDGVDWGTVAGWAQLRTDHGHAEPTAISLWEVGNEVYGGRPESGGDQCASFGWEEVWTCDGADYVTGNSEHDGYLAIREAMLAVDPTVRVGAVGVGDPGSWSDWGYEVIDSAGDALDFYVVHAYGFDRSPDVDDATERSRELWPQLIEASRAALPTDTPLAITEYNLISFEAGDTAQSMTRAINALFVADTIGQFAEQGVTIANQWNMANGTTTSGSDYGLVSADGSRRFPQFDAFAVWSRTGLELLDVDIGVDGIRVYPTRHSDGRLTIVVLNVRSEALTVPLTLTGRDDSAVTLRTYSASDPTAEALDALGPITIDSVDGTFDLDVPALSLNVLETVGG